MVSQTQSTHWNLALPSIASLGESVLPIVVNGVTCGVPLGQVQYVDHAGPLTRLPLTDPPIEGLIQFNGLPLIQLNVAQALGFPGQTDGKIVVITLPQGYLALKVDEVLGFASAKMATVKEHITLHTEDTYQDLPLLKVEEVFPWITQTCVTTPSIVQSDTSTDKIHGNIGLNGYMLLVSSANRTIGLLADSVDRIEEIGDSLPLRKFDTAADLLVRIENVLLPACSLAKSLKLEGKPERQAILIRGLEKPSVLVVEHVSRLERVDHFHLTVSPLGKKSLWYLGENKEPIEVVNAREFFGKTEEYTTLPLINPQSRWDNLPQLATKLSTEGVRIQCGNITCVLPLMLVDRILGDLKPEDLETANSTATEEFFERLQEGHKIPVIDGVTLFGQQHQGKMTNSHILLSLKCGQVVIAVHRAELQPTLPDDRWLPLTFMPPQATLLFDAAAFNETEKKWLLRVKTDINFADFPWKVKRSVVSSLLAWIPIRVVQK